jgi:hypothetical protein
VQDSTGWWRCIDTLGRLAFNVKYGGIDYVDTLSNIVYSYYNKLCIVTTFSGDTIVKPINGRFSRRRFTNGLLRANIYNTGMCYYNSHGKMIWQQVRSNSKIEDMNIDYFRSAQYSVCQDSAGPTIRNGTKQFNPCRNIATGAHIPYGQVSILMDSTAKDTFKQDNDKTIGLRFYLLNNTDTSIQFETTCHGICIVQQAFSVNNKWEDIEYSDNSWCCTGSDPVKLPIHKYWAITVPLYSGSFKTKMRLKVIYLKARKSRDRNDDGVIYSKEFEAFINPAQFYSERKSFDSFYYP